MNRALNIFGRVLYVLYAGILLGLALPIAVAIHAYDFAAHLEERWTLWIADWSKRNHP